MGVLEAVPTAEPGAHGPSSTASIRHRRNPDAIGAAVVLTQGPSPRCAARARGPPARSRSTVLPGVCFFQRQGVHAIDAARAHRTPSTRPRNAGEGAPWRRCVVEPRGLGQWLQAADEAGVAVRVRLRDGAAEHVVVW